VLSQEAIPEMAAKDSKHAKPKRKRKRPARLAKKLLTIRQRLNLSQDGMIRRLGLEQEIERDYVSKYERGILEPTLKVLLAYARAISSTGHGEFLETLIDDKQNLPVKLPADPDRQLRAIRAQSTQTGKKTKS
jgi:transcriptional regulator with XRE-family HTH domain